MKNNEITTKKFLVAFDPSQPEVASGDFLVPITGDAGSSFLGVKTKKRYSQGQMVYIGRAITVDEIVSKLVQSEHKVEIVEASAKTLEAYLRMLQDYKIGNILRIEPSAELECGFRLVKIADHETFEEKNLP